MPFGYIPTLNPRKLLRTPSFVGQGAEVQRQADVPLAPPNAMQQIALAAQQASQAASPAVTQAPQRKPGELLIGRPVDVPMLGGTYAEPPRTVGDPLFRAAQREPEVANMNFGVNPNLRTQPTPEMNSRGRMVTSKPDTVFNPVDYSRDPVGRARRDNQIQYNEKTPPRWKQALLMAVAGALQGAKTGNIYGVGAGAAAGALGGAVAPEASNDVLFDMFKRPRLEDDLQRERESDKAASDQRRAALDEIAKLAQVRHTEAQTDNIANELSLDRARLDRDKAADTAKQFRDEQNANLDREKFDEARRLNAARQKLIEAQTEAARRGTSKMVDIEEGDGVYKYQVFPDGSMKRVGRAPAKDKERPMSFNEALGEEEAAEGPVSDIVADSLAGREEAILSQLTPRERVVLAGSAKPMENNGVMQDEADLQAERQRVQSRYNTLKEAERRKITAETRDKRNSKARARMVGGRGGQPKGNSDDELLRQVRSNPRQYVDEMRAAGYSDERIRAALQAAGVDLP